MIETFLEKSPDKLVATQIIDSFLMMKLLPADLAESIRGQLAEGALTSEDWRSLAEKALELERQGQSNGPQE